MQHVDCRHPLYNGSKLLGFFMPARRRYEKDCYFNVARVHSIGGRATVIIKDNLGNPVANAAILGTFSGTPNEQRTGTTSSNGTAVIDSRSFQKTILSLKFCVDSVVRSPLAFTNPNTCGTLIKQARGPKVRHGIAPAMKPWLR
jgi:hypothetical protein